MNKLAIMTGFLLLYGLKNNLFILISLIPLMTMNILHENDHWLYYIKCGILNFIYGIEIINVYSNYKICIFIGFIAQIIGGIQLTAAGMNGLFLWRRRSVKNLSDIDNRDFKIMGSTLSGTMLQLSIIFIMFDNKSGLPLLLINVMPCQVMTNIEIYLHKDRFNQYDILYFNGSAIVNLIISVLVFWYEANILINYICFVAIIGSITVLIFNKLANN